MADYEPSSDCCGVGEIVGVGYPATKYFSEKQNRDSILRAIREAADDFKGMVYATTASHQGERADERMRDLGFRFVRRFKNPNSGAWVKFWIRETGMTYSAAKRKANRGAW